ncbi:MULTISPECIES: ABC transporter substrate-binding protein [Cobetia]|uniref:Carbohydrate ABC transporter substrate-binding protein n=1 Tax=Cobetia crustatorum TaxID=553385 RepID=A0A558HKA0_9GAMM|nr:MULTISPECIES: ABC transporter substrate-binding protein [Cobetia]TVU69565.1 carbohydrate ABC transporter substrate-binding protein [Cobetia crustatorum]
MRKTPIALTLMALLGSTPAMADINFFSTQARPLEEAQQMREIALAPYGEAVNYMPQEAGTFLSRLEAEKGSANGALDVLGGLHGELGSLTPAVLAPLDDLMSTLGEQGISEQYLSLGKLGGEQQRYIPWMQATYIMAASRKALPYLPEGADLNALSYDELLAWGRNIEAATGQPKLGFPAGRKGLIHRFLEGYLYPSFTHSVVREFRSDDAVAMWQKFREIWAVTNPRSTAFGFMQEPLLNGEVWVAFDHTARLKDAFNKRPDDFVAFPAPAGPSGRGYMPVVAGLAVPANAPAPDASRKLIQYLMTPEAQIRTLRATNFFPVVATELPDDLPASIRMSGKAVATQSSAEDAVLSLLPSGLGKQSGLFNKIYRDAFVQIVLRDADIHETLDILAPRLQALIDKSGAGCWLPDAPSDGPCPVK